NLCRYATSDGTHYSGTECSSYCSCYNSTACDCAANTCDIISPYCHAISGTTTTIAATTTTTSTISSTTTTTSVACTCSCYNSATYPGNSYACCPLGYCQTVGCKTCVPCGESSPIIGNCPGLGTTTTIAATTTTTIAATTTTICSCTPWTDVSCGGGACSGNQMLQARTCNPSGCDSQSRCVLDSRCCTSDDDCECYETCNLATNTCYDFRNEMTGCNYYDYCQGSSCPSSDDAFCYTKDLNQKAIISEICRDDSWACHNYMT
ncbi:MAG: hypothetical protein GW914_02000, partial [Candidatus Aenigmarchaeota archaeon]|nr:hypothetical protein [Candidatus Aenigmarchaeota archaeon]